MLASGGSPLDAQPDPRFEPCSCHGVPSCRCPSSAHYQASSSGLTDDVPYRPATGDTDDDLEILSTTKPGAPRPLDEKHAARWEPPQGREGRSLLAPPDAEFQRRLDKAQRKLDRGKLPSERDIEDLSYRAAFRLLGSRRPGAVVTGMRMLDKLERAPKARRPRARGSEPSRSLEHMRPRN
jgi:hypothetical protein